MKRTYSKEFKIKECELVLKDGIKYAVVAEKLGINKVMFFNRNHARYGSIRIRKELLTKGIDVSKYKISRILRHNGFEANNGRTGMRKKSTPRQIQYLEENLIRDKFKVVLPNYLWCSDINMIFALLCRGRINPGCLDWLRIERQNRQQPLVFCKFLNGLT